MYHDHAHPTVTGWIAYYDQITCKKQKAGIKYNTPKIYATFTQMICLGIYKLADDVPYYTVSWLERFHCTQIQQQHLDQYAVWMSTYFCTCIMYVNLLNSSTYSPGTSDDV